MAKTAPSLLRVIEIFGCDKAAKYKGKYHLCSLCYQPPVARSRLEYDGLSWRLLEDQGRGVSGIPSGRAN